MSTEKKTAVVIVTRNNGPLLQHAVDNYLRYDAGVPVKFYVADNESDPTRPTLSSQAKRLEAEVRDFGNDRVEHSFYLMGLKLKRQHSHVFFVHDDCVPHKDKWLKAFHDRMDSGYLEPETPDEFKHLPIGRVGAMHHFWRDYANVKGFPVQCAFLKECYERIYPEKKAPPAFKYADVDRVLISSACLKASPIYSTPTMRAFNNLTPYEDIMDRTLPYYDTGTYPASMYPAGQYWSRMTLFAEFMNSLGPLAAGYRTVGLEGDGYLEQIHGHDVPFGHDYIAHYGAPNALRFLAKRFSTTPEEAKKQMNNPVFLVKAHRCFKEYYN